MKQKVVVILGPTGVGKSKIGVEIANKFNGEIISADSVQIFKDFNIGSAKITEEETKGIKHHLIDFVSPNEEFTVYNFVSNAKLKIKEISSKNKLPIIVGGTALYAKSLIENYNFGETERDLSVRKELEKELLEKGIDYLFKKLKNLNQEMAKSIDKNNSVRLIRAIEIAIAEKEKTKSESEFDFLIFALNKDRQALYEQINRRVDVMIKDGLVDEVKSLVEKYGTQVQPFKAIGYKEVLPYIQNKYSKQEMIDLIKQHSRNYAKRQITFIKNIKETKWIDTADFDNAKSEIETEIEKWLYS